MLDVCVTKRFGDFVSRASFQLEERGITALFGPSGAGKTTLLDMVAGLLTPDEGKIALDGTVFFDSQKKVCLPVQSRGIGYVFQEHRLFPHLSVKGNLLFSPRFCGRPSVPGLFDRVVDLMGLRPMLSRSVVSLSGGESQRVAIGRAILASRSFLLMDEPLASLDVKRQDELLEYIGDIPRELGIPVLYVTHSSREIERIADRVLLIRPSEPARICGLRDLGYFGQDPRFE